MRKMIGALLALWMVLGSVVGAAAQATPVADANDGEGVAFTRGLNQPATWFSDRGDPIATISVTKVERGWQDYDEYYEPEPGVEYVAVTFEVNVIEDGNLILEPYGLSLLDGYGRNNSRSYAQAKDGVEILRDDTPVASGEVTEFTIVFEIYEEATIGYFMWQPTSGIIVMVDITGEA